MLYRTGQKLTRPQLNSLPVGSIVTWPAYGNEGRYHAFWHKHENGRWYVPEDGRERQVATKYLAGNEECEQACFVAEGGESKPENITST